MTLGITDRTDGKLDEVRAIAEARQGGKEAESFSAAIDVFFAHAASDEIAELNAEELYGASLALWKFCQKRKPGERKLRIYNPRIAEHGWESGHTILEVINDDSPFLVDSLTTLLTEKGIGIHALIHPVISVKRTAAGALQAMVAQGDAKSARESVIHVQIDQIGEDTAIAALEAEVASMFDDVKAATTDWREMLDRLGEVARDLKANGPKDLAALVSEAGEFLDWMHDHHFTFLGYRGFIYDKAADAFVLEKDRGLGLMRDPAYTIMRDRDGNFAYWTPELSDLSGNPQPIMVIKANRRSTVHRPSHFDVVAVKRYDAEGNVAGEHIFMGLFTSAAYNLSPREIPLLRGKVNRIIDRAGFAPSGHDAKALINVIETYPRDELFQSTDDQLFENAVGVLHLAIRPRPRLLTRSDRFDRFLSAIVYVPRERYTTELRIRIGNILCDALGGRVATWEPSFGTEGLARVQYVIALQGGTPETFDQAETERQIVEAVRSWSDILHDALIERHGEAKGQRLHARYGEAFSASYREEVAIPTAVADIDKLRALNDEKPLGLHFYRRLEDPDTAVRFKLYQRGGPVILSDALPVLENMGFRVEHESPYKADLGDVELYVHDFFMKSASGAEIDLSEVREKLEEAFEAVWEAVVDDDRLNRLVLLAGLSVRETALLRAYSRFLRQARLPFSIEYMEAALADNAAVARMLVSLFAALFDPAREGDADARRDVAAGISAQIDAALEAVPSLDVDTILRRFRNAITSTLRTNYYQPAADGSQKSYMSFKFDSGQLDDLPLPRPWREIFVYSTWIEGVHLRGGPVARGGLRWSDRKEDYRTEILGLVKAQQVKNAVIVPVGSKGGFLPKKLPAGGSREEVQAEAIRAYKTFLSGLLDVTDNLKAGEIVPPASVVRLDADDPYLVVAADKGTATFSDIANGIAAEYGFWLDDAFASGGSNGYDHKGMGITAKGAWEAVKRHFRELGHDTQTQPFTVIGCGDMSGDVFGNGMLLSEQIKLVAAFDHRDIFIDPDPDPARSFAERKRLFETPRTTWKDYDASLISHGGGVFPRSSKSIQLTPEIRKLTGIAKDRVTPFELIKALLSARCDLIWFGGIGTYIKAASESHADAGDRANDPIRVDAKDIRARVIGEGANLGVTQRGRIELGRHGVKVNTDAVDNSAGVDCSDHEVNIKIALGAVVGAGDMTEKQRNTLLAKMTDEVSDLVLANNYDQTLAISMIETRAATLLEDHARLMRALERDGGLNREVELLPNDEALAELRAAQLGLTRPEIAVLVAYAKIVVFDALSGSDLPDDPFCEHFLIDYMPTPLRKAHKAALLDHRLRREIIATVVANLVVNEQGPAFVSRVAEDSGATPAAIAKAFIAAREIFETEPLRDEINALDTKLPADAQLEMHLALSDLLASQSVTLLSRVEGASIGTLIDTYKAGVQVIATSECASLSDYTKKRLKGRTGALVKAGAPEALAARVGTLEYLGGALDIVDVARQQNRQVADVAETYFAAGARFGLDWLRSAARSLVPADHWERVALGRIVSDLRAQQSQIAAAAMRSAEKTCGKACIVAWASSDAEAVARADRLVGELKDGGPLTVAKLAVASSQFRSISG